LIVHISMGDIIEPVGIETTFFRGGLKIGRIWVTLCTGPMH
jgi:hypothetical protein